MADNHTRQNVIIRTSLVGILANLLIASVKIIIGLAASSLAVISEGVNNASDSLSSTLTLVGAKLSEKRPDKKHPFGYGRIEHLTSMVIALLILYTGIELLKESIEGIIHPGDVNASWLMIAVVAISAVGKFVLGQYTVRMGEKVDSSALVAVGEDSKNDSFFSIVTIAVALIYLFFHICLDAYAGVLFSFIILKTGFGTLKDTVSELLGMSGDHDLAATIYKEIRSTPGILNAADMMLHSYGPDNYSGSVNLEIDHEKTVGEIYAIIHALQLKIMHEYKVVMVFGIYAVDRDHEEVREMRVYINQFIKAHDHVTSFHALYLEPVTNKIYCDLVVDYDLVDWDSLRQDFQTYMNERYPGQELELTIETEYV